MKAAAADMCASEQAALLVEEVEEVEEVRVPVDEELLFVSVVVVVALACGIPPGTEAAGVGAGWRPGCCWGCGA